MALAASNLPPRYPVAGVLASATNYAECTRLVIEAAAQSRSLLLAATSVHGVTLAARNASFLSTLNSFDVVHPDGQPIRWALNVLHDAHLEDRVYGPTLMLHVCAAAAEAQLPVYFYGSTPSVLERMSSRLHDQFPSLVIAGYRSPPFRPLTPEEESSDAEAIITSGASIVFAGLGCPRQEQWAAKQRSNLPLPILCVGAAFDFHAGALRQAPAWMQRRGLEWSFRLAMEPRRLWRRYAQAVPFFMLLFARQFLAMRFTSLPDGAHELTATSIDGGTLQ